ncbi:hypothetical protein DB88DRAFT_483850 [Papiliotrema laurentii]|uniref:Protein CPL1-like domain-containing protein n=1 Tax=Papiliotrema laurentii TaxID=5418 RepID=A0AAD9L6W5_PAPLA|nr:hypothetical protein DB88DRAFT_483850 [Papiliotrema laurentii]
MRFSTLLNMLVIVPVAMSMPTPSMAQPESRGLTFLHEHHARHNKWEPRVWSASQRTRTVPSAIAQRDAPAVLPLGSKNDLARCPAPAIACPTDPISPEAVSSSTEWECISPEEDLYSCGGCATLGTGMDCTTIPSVLSVSCQVGACQVHTCDVGFVPASDGLSCVEATPATGAEKGHDVLINRAE